MNDQMLGFNGYQTSRVVQRPVRVQRRREKLLGAGANQKGGLEEAAGFRAFVGESISGRGARRAFRGGRRPEQRHGEHRRAAPRACRQAASEQRGAKSVLLALRPQEGPAAWPLSSRGAWIPQRASFTCDCLSPVQRDIILISSFLPPHLPLCAKRPWLWPKLELTSEEGGRRGTRVHRGLHKRVLTGASSTWEFEEVAAAGSGPRQPSHFPRLCDLRLVTCPL